MIIKRYVCKRFAGIKDKDIEFEDGLNVILGYNEAGKSTLIEGIHSVIFKPSKVGNRSVEDKEFRKKFFPVPTGDSIDGEVVISLKDQNYILRKEWGADPSAELTLPDSTVLKKEDNIQETLKDVLKYGEGTYTNIFFSKQRHIKEAIEKIIDNKDATSEVSTLLRRAVMELDGISLDKLERRIDEEIKRLLARWDIEKNYPENNRGISNPYRVGMGEVLQSFYKKETIKLEMERANKAEKEFDKICNEIKEVQLKLEQLQLNKESMEKLEEDITQRSILEPKIDNLNSQITGLSKINQEWPRNEEKLKQIKLDIKTLEEEASKLEEEKTLSNRISEKARLAETISKTEDINKRINETNEKIVTIKNITKEDIEVLQKNYNNMINTESMLKAGVILGQLNHLKDDTELIITKDFEDPSKINMGDSFQANGYMKLEIENTIEIELRSGDIDFKDLKENYDEHKKNFESLLEKLEVKTLEEAKINKEKLEEETRLLERLKNQKDLFLAEDNYESLKEKLDSLGDLSQVREIDIIQKEIKDLNSNHIKLLSEKSVLESKIQQWIEEYKDQDGLFDKIIEIKMSQKEINKALEKLAPLPEDYDSAAEFREELRRTRLAYESNYKLLTELKELYYEGESNLPSSTYEELSKDYLMEESLFNKKLDKAKRLLKIKESFEKTKVKMDDSSFNPFIDSFSDYLVKLTNGNYKAKEIDNGFNLKIEKENEALMPLDLLSTGTYDSVALALRLALLDNMLEGNKGFLILDDCLVDLDPYRKEMAVGLINEFAQKHQVIFSTCSPETADLLGGNLINI